MSRPPLSDRYRTHTRWPLSDQPEPMGERDARFPVKLNDDYTCQGRDRDGEYVVFEDLLSEGDCVASVVDEEGNHFGPFGVVVHRPDGLWIVWEGEGG